MQSGEWDLKDTVDYNLNEEKGEFTVNNNLNLGLFLTRKGHKLF